MSLTLDLTEVETKPVVPPGAVVRKLLRRPDERDGDLSQFGPHDFIMEMDWSSLESLLTCPRSALWKLLYSRIANGRRAALDYGSAVHHVLEHVYRGTHTPEEAIASQEQFFIDNPPNEGEYRNFDFLRSTMEKYFAEYNPDPFVVHKVNGKPLVECPFAIPIATIAVNAELPFTDRLLTGADSDYPLYIDSIHCIWTGMIDMLIELGGALWVADHKTSSVLGDSYFKSFELSQQFIGYTWAAQQLIGEQVKGCWINAINTAKRGDRSTSKPFFRRPYTYPAWQVSEWRTSIVAHLEDLVHRLKTGLFPASTQWCVGKFGTCSYHDVCSEPPERRLRALSTDLYSENCWSPFNT